jgi:kinesin family protein 1
MLEIYNEKIHDLLTPVAKRLPGGLKVREHKVYGVYVEGLAKHTVHNYGEIESCVALGN